MPNDLLLNSVTCFHSVSIKNFITSSYRNIWGRFVIKYIDLVTERTKEEGGKGQFVLDLFTTRDGKGSNMNIIPNQ